MRARNQLVLDSGQVVGYGWTKRDGYIRCRFAHPQRPGRYVEVSTGVRAPAGWTPTKQPPAACVLEAARIIKKYHVGAVATGSWDAAMAEVRNTSGLRPATLRNYENAVRQLRKVLPDVVGPAAMTAELAARFKRLYAAGFYAKSPLPGSPTYTRSPVSVAHALRQLSSLWSVHFKELGYAAENPWLEVATPDVPKKEVVVPAEENFEAFFAWLNQRFGGWELVNLFCEVKAIAGCRTLDLCSAKSADLDGDILTLQATKTKKPRRVPLSSQLATRLRKAAGPTWLWEHYHGEAKVRWPATNRPAVFTVESFYHAVRGIFRAYNDANPTKKIKPHDLRKRAVTLTTLASGGSVDQAAEAIGLDPQTARRYYNDASKSLRGEELMRRMADVLSPKRQEGGTK